jgi:hypothetical protein
MAVIDTRTPQGDPAEKAFRLAAMLRQVFGGGETDQETALRSYLFSSEGAETAKMLVRDSVRRSVQLEEGKSITEEDVKKLGKASTTMEAKVPDLLPGFPGLTPEMMADLEKAHPEEALAARAAALIEKTRTPERVAGGEVGKFETEEARVEAEKLAAERQRDIARYVDANLDIEVEGKTAVMAAINALKAEEIKGEQLDFLDQATQTLGDLWSSMNEVERRWAAAGGFEGLMQYWTLMEQERRADQRTRAANAKTIPELIEERARVRVTLMKDIADQTSRARELLELDRKKHSGEIQLYLDAAMLNVRDMNAIDPHQAYIEFNRLRGLFGGFKGFESKFHQFRPSISSQIDAVATELAKSEWNPELEASTGKDPVIQELRDSPLFKDQLTQVSNEALVDAVRGRALELRGTPQVEELEMRNGAQAAVIFEASGGKLEDAEKELAEAEDALAALEGTGNRSNLRRQLVKVRNLRVRNFFLKLRTPAPGIEEEQARYGVGRGT